MSRESDRLARFVALVEHATTQRLAELERRHACCVAPGLGPVLLARRFRADRLPDGEALEVLAVALCEWALGLRPGSPRPYADDDLTRDDAR
jgi:hypothetical protein